MRIKKRTNLAMRVLMYCAVNPESVINKTQIARRCNASDNHLGHVVNWLGRFGYLETMRGRHGGVRLARNPAEISVGEVFRDFEENAPVTDCFAGGDNSCPLAPVCRLRDSLFCAVEAFYAHLDGVMLDTLVDGNEGLHDLLGQP